MRFSLLIIGSACLISCAQPTELKTGIWRGVIEMQGQQLPFNFEVALVNTKNPVDTSSSSKVGMDNETANKGQANKKYIVYLKNAGEKLTLDEITLDGDTVRMVLHIFDAELVAKVSGSQLDGYYVKNFEKNYRLPFHAMLGEDYRFTATSQPPSVNFTGKYSVRFVHERDTTVSVGVFRQTGNYIEGTFLNPDGDYRYLEGNVFNDKMWLSTFDGHHAYLFSATRKDEATLTGDYWSGKTRHEIWVGMKNDHAALPDLESLTFLKKGFERLAFHFPDVDGHLISPEDERYRNKILILQIFGTWCPNCMDETRFLSDWYSKNKDRGVEILGLAYERKADFGYASGRVKIMKDKLGVGYDFVIAGTSDKALASETLPALNKIMAFPTTIFIGKDGKVKKIHTGFSGPGTGIYFDQYKVRFNETVNELLSEKLTSSKN